MRTRLFLLFAFAAVTVLMNGATAGNIAHGVEVVVIDAGHGGKFPGAHYGNVYEKDLTLKVALKLGKLIEERMPGVKVVYTRKTDKALGTDLATDLQARADIANKAGGDLFVSIHVNAAKSSAARGVETLIMGESPKEQRYNENALFENNREDLIDMSDERTAAIVRAYIQNLQFTYGEYSMALARCIQNNYLKAGRHSRGIKPQLLRVLYATDMPGVLTEIGFMSNAQEMAYMKSEKGQDEIARSIYEGVKDYSAYVLETRRAGEEAAASPKPVKEPETQVVIGKEPVRPAEQDKASDTPAGKSGRKPAGKAATPEKAEPQKAAGKSGAQKPEPQKPAGAEAAPNQAARPLRYTVQVLASAQTVPTSSARFKSYRNKVKQYTAEGRFRYKYCVGEYDTRAAAQKRLAEVRKVFPDAFVVSCRGTQIVK
ncbi:N-acetylmuramoyl-L-alanine amidase [Alistipes onderdonkii]|jgi:N-acetylmuramoyl-L-alanine amidase|uniref:N-acetylmuramoyl-L-alanine amidase n=1 Tax=Alistipes onderdonkii TaxID=328813 RepID=A0A1Y3QXQ5_9BACT|nr:N-acetylmuramoyl-L-alanine amidase [Alistipes onderdonkii]OUN04416.1 N-acetylmuramoyl-L-alanine amidase [Alistipes onderdonkii]